ncbi:hypothetical protein [Humidisolicoccus flavus]|uniref:hypothetical protein n=1 Tax=Humidisolicoccus flavus TaxID=3111414 RepID=UPI003253D957
MTAPQSQAHNGKIFLRILAPSQIATIGTLLVPVLTAVDLLTVLPAAAALLLYLVSMIVVFRGQTTLAAPKNARAIIIALAIVLIALGLALFGGILAVVASFVMLGVVAARLGVLLRSMRTARRGQ